MQPAHTEYTRRGFLKVSALGLTIPAIPLAGTFLSHGRDPARGRLTRLDQTDPWYGVQQSFSVDRSLIHLNNGGVCPAPIPVMQALSAHQAASNSQPFYAHRAGISPQMEGIRVRLAHMLGCGPEEVALTRNTSEGMEIVQMGLELEPGDEVVTTAHDYPRMLQAWQQRARRDGIRIEEVPVPVPLDRPSALVDAIVNRMSSRTRLVMCCHMVDLTGQIHPVREICRAAHTKGIPVLVDGAQTFGHFPFSVKDLECDFYATSLHKWMMGPEGTGLLFVRRDRIPEIWPLMPPEEADGHDIRKFEDLGTRPMAPILALAEAMTFHSGIGAADKTDRLRTLRDYWLDQVLPHDRIRLLTNLDQAGGMATVQVEGMDPVRLRNHLWDRHRIRVRPIDQVNVHGIRVSPSIYNTLPELDYFVRVLKDTLADGLPTS